MITYLCDKKKECNEECGQCKHTQDIKHAKNFKREGEDYIEQEPNFGIGDLEPRELYQLLINEVKYETLLRVVANINHDIKSVLK